MLADNTGSPRSRPKKAARSAARRPGPPYRLYGLVMGSFFVVRFLDLATQHSDWAVWVYNSGFCRLVLTVTAACLSFFAGHFLKRRMPRLMAWLVCGFLGAAAMLLINSTVGLAIGLLLGGVAIYSRPSVIEEHPQQQLLGLRLPRFLGGVLPNFFVVSLPTLLLGLLTGAMSVLVFLHFGQSSRVAEWVTLVGSLLLGYVAWVVTLFRMNRQRRWHTWIGAHVLFLTLVIIGFYTTCALDSQRRRWAIAHVQTSPQGFFPSGLPNKLLNTIYTPSLTFGIDSSDADIGYARGFPGVLWLSFERGSRVTDEGFRQLPCRYLSSFRCADGTPLTDASACRIDFSRLESLELEGPRFSDAALGGLSTIPRMRYLNLRNSKVTSAGLQHLDPLAPLWMLDLSNTRVDDDILPALGKLTALRQLRLAGTQITGRGLKHLRGLSIRLDLSDTPLQDAFLADLLAPEGEEATLWNEALIHSLELRGVPLSEQGIETICKMNSLAALNIMGSELSPTSLARIGRIRALQSLGMDGIQLTVATLPLLESAPQLELRFDAAEMTLSEIGHHLQVLERAGSSSLEAKVETGRIRADLRIENLVLRDTAVLHLLDLQESYGIKLIDVVLPDGSTASSYAMHDLMNAFPTEFARYDDRELD